MYPAVCLWPVSAAGHIVSGSCTPDVAAEHQVAAEKLHLPTDRSESSWCDYAADAVLLVQAFLDRFTKVAPSTLTPPNFPSEHISEAAAKAGKQEDAPSSDMPDKLTFSFYLPHATIGKAKKVGLCL